MPDAEWKAIVIDTVKPSADTSQSTADVLRAARRELFDMHVQLDVLERAAERLQYAHAMPAINNV
jgi:hypothetical protein